MENIAVVGASPKEDRYSFKALDLLLENGFNAIPVAPKHEEILGKKVYASLADIKQPIDTVTMYVGSARQVSIIRQILLLKPRRVIFNPGTENASVYQQLRDAGIEVVEGCTLIMLNTGQF